MSQRDRLPSATNRRQFLTASSLATAGLLAPSSLPRRAIGEDGDTGETEHFHYRLAPADGPWIDTQRGSRSFGTRAGKIYLSEDNSETWVHEADFADAANIHFSSFLENGRLIFATQRKIYSANEDLSEIREITVTGLDGKPYHPHKLREGEKPGWYFYSLDGIHTFDVKGKEILIWGNYCNVGTGPVPSNVYYSVDGGETIKIAYGFGQNPAFNHKDAKPEEMVGNPDNPVVCRHIHSVTYNPVENAFYACSGDINRKIGVGLECHWLRGKYDADADTWDWKVVVSSDANSRFKTGGMNFVDGKIYWVADANGPKTIREVYDRGIFRCKPEDIPDKSKHELLFPAKWEMAVMTIHENTMVVPRYGNADPADCGILVSPDLGKTWGNYDLKQFGDRSGVRVNLPNDEGWYRIQLMERWINNAEILFIKMKS